MRLLLYKLLISIPFFSYSQDFSSFTETVKKFYTTPQEAEILWRMLTEENKIPFVVGDSVAFLYYGDAKSVAWVGDFNGWGSEKFPNKGSRIPDTNIWILKVSFPKDARLDYKILLNEKDWVIDPINPNQQWTGVGGGSPNSELRMSAWLPDPITQYREGITRGKLEKDILYTSKVLGYQITYSVYYPVGFDKHITYPILYVTDGYEYLHERLGNMKVILDNLIEEKKMQPILVAFIDHRDPVNRSNNRRMHELTMNSKYLDFMTEEFLPDIEGKLKVSKDPRERGILGNSTGGLTAAYFAFAKSKVFGLAGIQSPAFWFKPEIYSFCDQAENPPIKIYLTSGSIHDAQEGALKMKSILEKNTCTYHYTETNQGHSWGNFRDTIDDILVYFFPLSN